MAEAPALTLPRTRDISVAPSRESIPTLATIREVVINRVLPLTKGIVQETDLARSSYVIPTTDRGNIRISTPADRLDGSVIVNYTTKLGKGEDMRDARVAITLENGYASATVSGMQPNHPVVDYKPPQEELAWLSGVLISGDIQSAQAYNASAHKAVEDASPIGV